MKIKYIFIGIVFIISSILTFESCGNNSGSSKLSANKTIRLNFDTLTIVEREHLQSDTTKSSCYINLAFVYPIEGEKVDIHKLQNIFITSFFGVDYDSLSPNDAMNKYVQNFIDNYEKDANVFHSSLISIEKLESLSSDSVDEEYTDYFNSYYEFLDDSVTYLDNLILSFQVKQSISKDGVSTFDTFRNRVIDLKRGVLITESEIFKVGYEQTLKGLFVNSLMEQNDVRSILELEELGFFGIEEMLPNNNFLLNNLGIIYRFNKGEYSAYQLDAPEIFIPFELLKPILKENSIIRNITKIN